MLAVDQLMGPRAPAAEVHRRRLRYRLPIILLAISAVLLVASTRFPYWKMTLLAPQYPGGLTVVAHIDRLSGDVQEIDGLNHYIGMRPLEDGARLERRFGIYAIVAFAVLLLGGMLIHTRWVVLLAAPAMTFCYVFVADLYLWLRHFGLNLDPHAPLNRAVKPFVPTVFGVGTVGQFKTEAWFQSGFYMAFAASWLILAALYFHRRAYKPLVDASSRS